MGDDTNFFDQDDDDVSDNIIPLKNSKRKKKQEGWKEQWHLSNNASPLPNLFNVMLTLRNHPALTGVVRFDEMLRIPMVARSIPGIEEQCSYPRPLTDRDVIAIQEEIQLTGLRRVARSTVQDGIDLAAAQNRYHPLLDYLNSLVWDGETRIYGWLSRYLGVEGSAYADKIGELFLIALVARQFSPGCKADYMLILEGPQGAQKSAACKIIAGDYFDDNLPDLSRGDAVRLSQHLRGKWLIEIAEMSSFSKAESNTLKDFVTKTVERFIPKFGRNEVVEPRQCLFIGTTNESSYLRDETGARRFWPVAVGDIDLAALAEARDQLLAEAVVMYRRGRPWWPERGFEAAHIAPEQSRRYEADVWEATVEEWLETGGTLFDAAGNVVRDQWGNEIKGSRIMRCTVNEILTAAINMKVSMIGTREQRRISAILTRLKWKRLRLGNGRYFTRPDSS